MAEYNWNASLLRRVFVVPEEVADKHLRLAGAVQLKVLLWLSRHDGVYDDEACSKAVGASAPDCRDALRYWIDAGVLSGGAVSAPAPTPPPKAEPPKPAAVARPLPVKPQMPQVIERRSSSPEFAYLLDEFGARLGRPLSPTDMETLLYLFDTAGLPTEVLLMVVGYAASNGRCAMRYIEKVALDWADQGIVTMAAAEEHLCRMERAQQALQTLTEVCGLAKVPTGIAARDAAEKWLFDWQIAHDVLRLAHDVCVQKTGKFQVRYIDRILENWREQGADTAEKAAALSNGKPIKEEVASEYEDMVAQYTPVYKKKRKKEG